MPRWRCFAPDSNIYHHSAAACRSVLICTGRTVQLRKDILCCEWLLLQKMHHSLSPNAFCFRLQQSSWLGWIGSDVDVSFVWLQLTVWLMRRLFMDIIIINYNVNYDIRMQRAREGIFYTQFAFLFCLHVTALVKYLYRSSYLSVRGLLLIELWFTKNPSRSIHAEQWIEIQNLA